MQKKEFTRIGGSRGHHLLGVCPLWETVLNLEGKVQPWFVSRSAGTSLVPASRRRRQDEDQEAEQGAAATVPLLPAAVKTREGQRTP